MQTFRCSLICTLLFQFVIASINVPQVPLSGVVQESCELRANAGNAYGWRGPGIYRIINYGFQYAATLNGSSMGTAVVSM